MTRVEDELQSATFGMEIQKKGGDNMDRKEPIVLDVPLEDISTDGEKVIIDSPKLAAILKAEKETKDYTGKAVVLSPVVPVVPLKDVTTAREKVIITSSELARIVQAEKDAQTEKMSVTMGPPTPQPPIPLPEKK